MLNISVDSKLCNNIVSCITNIAIEGGLKGKMSELTLSDLAFSIQSLFKFLLEIHKFVKKIIYCWGTSLF